jgi:hypothetical protein
MVKLRDDDFPQHHLQQGHYGDLSLDEFPDATGYPSGTTVVWDGASWYLGEGSGGPFIQGPAEYQYRLLSGINLLTDTTSTGYIYFDENYVEIGDGGSSYIYMQGDGLIVLNNPFGDGMVIPKRGGLDPSPAQEGQMYYNIDTQKFRGYDGTTWTDLN